jgi:hypothetical protein
LNPRNSFLKSRSERRVVEVCAVEDPRTVSQLKNAVTRFSSQTRTSAQMISMTSLLVRGDERFSYRDGHRSLWRRAVARDLTPSHAMKILLPSALINALHWVDVCSVEWSYVRFGLLGSDRTARDCGSARSAKG